MKSIGCQTARIEGENLSNGAAKRVIVFFDINVPFHAYRPLAFIPDIEQPDKRDKFLEWNPHIRVPSYAEGIGILAVGVYGTCHGGIRTGANRKRLKKILERLYQRELARMNAGVI